MSSVEESKRINTSAAAGSKSKAEGAAVIFVRHKATMGIGHVGWGFLVHPGENQQSNFSLIGDGNVWEIGAVENHHGTIITPPFEDGYWHHRTAQPLDEVAGRGYDHYKVVPVDKPDVEAAFREENVIKERPYIAAVGNCMNDVHNILMAYGVKSLPDPAFISNWAPNVWYAHIDADEFEIEDRGGLQDAPSG